MKPAENRATTTPDLGARLRAARERRGWSREEVAYRSGLSWSGLAQIESGRRTNVRPATLAALAYALAVTVDYLVQGPAPMHRPLLNHRALFYTSDDAFIALTAPMLRAAVHQSDAVLVVTTRPHAALLRAAVAEASEHVVFRDSADWYASPGHSLGAYSRFVRDRVNAGASWVTIVGEPVWPRRAPRQVAAWIRYECVLNFSFENSPVTLVCPYHVGTLSENIVSNAEVTHPQFIDEGGISTSANYREPEVFLLTS